MNEGFPGNNKSIRAEDSEAVVPAPPQFIKEFSKDNSQEERDELAAAIREKRQERDAFRVEQNELTVE
jgi:hypothetical protein